MPPHPEVKTGADAGREIQAGSDWIREAVADGIASAGIGIFVSSNDQLARARPAVKAGHTQVELYARLQQPQGRVAIGTMHFAKGLEYKATIVMASDDDVACVVLSSGNAWLRRPAMVGERIAINGVCGYECPSGNPHVV